MLSSHDRWFIMLCMSATIAALAPEQEQRWTAIVAMCLCALFA